MSSRLKIRAILQLVCLLLLAPYVWMMDLKGISTDEGIRLWIINGGQPFAPDGAVSDAGWAAVLAAGAPFAYQPLFYLMLNSLMRLAETHDVLFFRAVNIFFLWVCLQGLVALSRGWRLVPRLFLLSLFALNAYLFMHVLQIREYLVGLAFYVWSSWLVLRLDQRRLERPWGDAGWFAGYGFLLALGFFIQSWVVFPAVAQGIFLVLRRREEQLRFYAHLALSYLVVLALARPYLETHQQKVAVGRWGTDGTQLGAQLADGFHLVLGGHLAGQSHWGDFLCWFWPAVILGSAVLLFHRALPPEAHAESAACRRQGWLITLCIGLSLGFQIVYYLKVDTLSLWPRYFIIHYFFLTWLIALAFKNLHGIGSRADVPPGWQRGTRAATAVVAIVLLGSGLVQANSYYRDPYLDTGFSRESDWRILSAGVARLSGPDDVVLTHDFIQRTTLTFTRPFSQSVLILSELETGDLRSARRVVYLESARVTSERADLAARLAALGFTGVQEIGLTVTADGPPVPGWRLVAFTRQ